MNSVNHIYIAPGDLVVTATPALLNSTPLGSCIAVVAYLKEFKLGAMAHIMLPGKPLSSNKTDDLRYAIQGIEALFTRIKSLSGKSANIPVAIIGGANVLKKENDTLTPAIKESVIAAIKRHKGEIVYQDLGGILRRSVMLNTQSGEIFISVGDQHQKYVTSL